MTSPEGAKGRRPKPNANPSATPINTLMISPLRDKNW